jgi:hypothetical protein
MSEVNDQNYSRLLGRLDVLIYLTLDGNCSTPTAKITKLSELNLKTADIASIVGKPANYVNAVLSSAKKAKRKKN